MEKLGLGPGYSTYKYIALIILFTKVLKKIMKQRVENSMQLLDVAQGGFLRQIVARSDVRPVFDSERANSEEVPDFQVFPDIKDAYNSVDREIYGENLN